MPSFDCIAVDRSVAMLDMATKMVRSRTGESPRMQPLLSSNLRDSPTRLARSTDALVILCSYVFGQHLLPSAEVEGMAEFARRVAAQAHIDSVMLVYANPYGTRSQFPEFCQAMGLVPPATKGCDPSFRYFRNLNPEPILHPGDPASRGVQYSISTHHL